MIAIAEYILANSNEYFEWTWKLGYAFEICTLNKVYRISISSNSVQNYSYLFTSIEYNLYAVSGRDFVREQIVICFLHANVSHSHYLTCLDSQKSRTGYTLDGWLKCISKKKISTQWRLVASSSHLQRVNGLKSFHAFYRLKGFPSFPRLFYLTLQMTSI